METPDGREHVHVPYEVQRCRMMIMTSYENHNETVEFFRSNNYFGGSSESFYFFPQSMLPAVDESGKIFMQSKSRVKLAPNGNGALFDAI